ncbi:hypothetical protein RHMOL_Rhmol10G0235700 [Rhododendron molle]|uniref:Uncharacterized protein n=1 Tax=Rhododendron molle TaxID=49168 RepID=A0ACC0M5J2_RHOML|nr:hypothetical protein RHMOL_Rhmol10G0235700 [Rhododendron molle]
MLPERIGEAVDRSPIEGSRVWKKADLAAEQRMSRPGNGCSGRAIDLAAEASISQGDFGCNRLLG